MSGRILTKNEERHGYGNAYRFGLVCVRVCACASASGDHIVMGDGDSRFGGEIKSSDVSFLNTCV